CQNTGPGRSALLSCRALPVPRSSAAQSSRAGFCDSRVPTAHVLHFVNDPVSSGTHDRCPRRRRAIHKAQRFSRMRSGHPAVTEAARE
ncbi:unnamed protein product, partial [Staurois parvus]